MRQNVYLAGLISTVHPQSLDWRDTLVERWENNPRIQPISPMFNKDGLASNTPDGGITDTRLEPGDILLRDYSDVMRSNLLLVNLNLWGSPRPMVGTWPELGRAWEHKKPVLAVATPGDSNYDLVARHPFARGLVTHYFNTVEEAANFVEFYYARN